MAMLLFLQFQADSAGTPESSWGAYFQMLGALLLVLMLVFLALRYLLPVLPAARAVQNGLIRVRAAFPLEPKKRLYLIETGNKVLLLASTDQSLNLLAEIPADSIPPAPTADATAPRIPFADWLKRGRS